MLTVTNYKVSQSKDGNKFISLVVEGGIEMVQSQSSGSFYAKSKRCFIPFTASESAAKAMIGTTIPGTIERVSCSPYEFKMESGEVMTLFYTYQFQPEQVEIVSQEDTEEEYYPSVEALEA